MKPALLLLAVALMQSTVVACDCRPPSVQTAFRNDTAIFIGRCVSGKVINQTRGRYRQFEFGVLRSWKGPTAKTLIVCTGMTGASCGAHFEVGRTFLVYADSSDGILSTTLCHRGGDLNSVSKGELKDLDALSPQLSESSTSLKNVPTNP